VCILDVFVGFITLILILTIAFETAQQLYYINKYDIAEGVTFLELFKGRAYRFSYEGYV